MRAGEVLVDGLDHSEGVAWDPDVNKLDLTLRGTRLHHPERWAIDA